MEPNRPKANGNRRPDIQARAEQIERRLKSMPRSDGQPPQAAPRTRTPGGSSGSAPRRPAESSAGAGFFELPDAPAMEPRRRTETPRPSSRRRRRRSMPTGMFFLLSAAFILTVSWGITAIIELPGKRAEAARLAQEQSASSAPSAAPEGEIGPVKNAGAGYTPLTAAVIAQPENGRVDMKYFDDALFIGDSLTRGFEEYASGIPGAHYAAYIGAGPRQFMEGLVQNRAGEQVAAIDEILAAAPKKVYILLGTNALPTLTDDAFLKYYNDLLDFLAPQLPADTVYYIQSIPPATAEKMEGDENFSQERVQAINKRLAQMAYARGYAFLDLYGALADDTGTLRADIASGDIHLNNAGYSLWREFLITHTVYRRDNPYLPGSPCYLA